MGANIKIGANTSFYDKAINKMLKDTKELKQDFNLAKVQASAFGDSVEGLKNKSNILSATLNSVNSRLEAQQQKQKVLSGNMNLQKENLSKLNSEYDKENNKLKELGKTLGKNSEEYKLQAEVVDKAKDKIRLQERAIESTNNALSKNKTAINKSKIEQIQATKSLKDTREELVKQDSKWNKFKSSIDSTKNKLSSFNKVAGQTVTKLGHVGGALASATSKLALGSAKATAKGLLGLTTALGGVSIASVKTVSDLTEVQNVVDTVFGEASKDIDSFSRETSTKFGISELAAKQYAGTIGAMFKSMGLGEKEVEQFSKGIVGLSGDMASFYNLDPEEAFNKLRSGISGETEPLKQLGINMSVANLEAYALKEGITKQYKEMNQAEQATLRYNYILSATKDAQGDFSKTSDTLANQLRVAKLNIQDLSGEIGKKLIPSFTNMAPTANKTMGEMKKTLIEDGFDGLAAKVGESLSDGLQAMAEKAPSFVDMGTKLINSFLDSLSSNKQKIGQSLSKLFSSIMNGFFSIYPKVITLGLEFLSNFLTGLTKNKEGMKNSVINVVTTIANAIKDNVPTIISTGGEILLALLSALTQNPTAISDTITTVINSIASFFSVPENIVTILNCGIEIIASIVKGITDSLPQIGTAVGTIVNTMLTWIIENPDKLFEIAWNIVKGIATGIGNALNEFTGGDEIEDRIDEQLGEHNFLKTGANIVSGIGDGMLSGMGVFGMIAEKLKNTILGKIMDKFEIHSPSRLMAREIGKYIPQGIGVGIEGEMPKLNTQITSDINTTVDSLRSTKENIAPKIQDKQQPIYIVVNNETILDGDVISKKTVKRVENIIGKKQRNNNIGKGVPA